MSSSVRTTRPNSTEKSALDALLVQLEAARLLQYESVDYDVDDNVSLAYRDSVLRAIGEIRTARERLAEGSYGQCLCCLQQIPIERLELLPSASMCVRCAVHTRGG